MKLKLYNVPTKEWILENFCFANENDDRNENELVEIIRCLNWIHLETLKEFLTEIDIETIALRTYRTYAYSAFDIITKFNNETL